MSDPTSSQEIAIVGMAAVFAGAPDMASYWQNILDRVDAVHEAPADWAEPYYDPQARRNDRIYTRMGGFLGDCARFDPLEYGIMPNAVDGGEPDQYLALRLAAQALRDAGYEKREFDRERTGVILGRGTYVNRGYTNLMQHGLVVDQTLELLRALSPELREEQIEALRSEMKKTLPPFAPEMLPGLVPNVVTGRVANRLNLMGPNFIVDAACASSLIAIELAMRELRSGRCDMVLTGGIHASTPAQIYMIFCQLEGLARQKLRPFDATANGTLLGEGGGVLVLKRLADAQRDKDRIYALVRGTGSSSDGRALGLLAPRLEGEALAMKRAYASCGIEPRTVGLIEAHGTGIPLGDQTEIQSLAAVFGERTTELPRHALGSVKSMIGHCIPAAGVAGVIKSALALHHKVLPPMLCDNVSAALEIERRPFYINNQPRPWIHGATEGPRRAAVNAFGFGGVNAHVVLEEYPTEPEAPAHSLYMRWPEELLVISGSDQAGLLANVQRIRDSAAAVAGPTLAALGRALARRPTGDHRLAVLATDRADLVRKLDTVLHDPKALGRSRTLARSGVFYGHGTVPGKVAFLFPGEGAQYGQMLSELCMHFPEVRKWFDLLDQAFVDRGVRPSEIVFPPPTAISQAKRTALDAALFEMDVAAELVFTASMGLYELTKSLGLRPDAMLGHSTGENTALVASGMLVFAKPAELIAQMRALNHIYQELNRAGRIPRGALLTVGACARETWMPIVEASQGRLQLAMDNCPNQVVLFGPVEDVQQASRRLAASGAVCVNLPFDRAYHTPFFADVAAAFRTFYDAAPFGRGSTPVYSCATAAPYPDEPEAARTLATSQWSSRVRFRESIERLYEEGFRIFVELGPSGNLTAFVRDILGRRSHLALAADNRRRPGLSHLLRGLAKLWAQGVAFDVDKLYATRAIEPIDLEGTVSRPQVAPPPHKVLALGLPRITLKPETIAALRSKGGMSKPAPAPTPPMLQAVSGTSAAGGEARSETAAPLRLLESHFGLMQEFLQSQARLLDRLAAPAAESVHTDWPMLGRIVTHDDDELVAERRFDLDHDLFLRDHVLGGRLSDQPAPPLALPVMPFTFSMEIVAQAAMRLAGVGRVLVGLRQLRGYRWLTLDRGTLTLRIHARMVATAAEETVVDVRIYDVTDVATAVATAGVLVFEGQAALAGARAASPVPTTDTGIDWKPATIPDDALYTSGMFHGPRLQGVTHLRRWSANAIEAELEVLPLGGLFAPGPTPVFQIDAGLLDAAGQLVGYWLSEQFGSDFNCFPFRVTAFEQYAAPGSAGDRVRCLAHLRFIDQTQIEASFDLFNSAGVLIARVEGWQDRYFKIPPSFYRVRLNPREAYLSIPWLQQETGLVCRRIDPFADDFLDQGWAIWKRVLAHLVLAPPERETWYGMSGDERRRTEWLLGRIAAKDAVREWTERRFGRRLAPVDVEIRTNAEGKPYAVCEAAANVTMPDVSISHSHGHVVAAVAATGSEIGIDLQRVHTVRSRDLIDVGFDASERELLAGADTTMRHALTVGFWCAREAVAKCAGTGLLGTPRRWRVVGYDPQAAQVAVRHESFSGTARLLMFDSEIFAFCLRTERGPQATRHEIRKIGATG